MLRFSQRVVPMGQVPSGGRAETGSASPSPASIAAVTVLTKSGAASETTGGRFGLLAFTGWSGTSASDSRARASACQLRSTSSLTFTAVAFGDGCLQFRQRAITRQDLG